MDDNSMKIVVFTEDEDKTRYFDALSAKYPEINCSFDICHYKIHTEEIFLRYTPRLLFVDLTPLPPAEQTLLMDRLERISELIPMVGILREEQKLDAIKFVRQGMRDMVVFPFKDQEIIKVIHRFRKILPGVQHKKTGKLYTFLNFKGGVGNTFVTVNTAINMARLTQKKVLLWDMALQAGDIPFFLNYKPEFTLINILENLDQIDTNYIQGVLPAADCGVSILAAPTKIESLDQLAPEKIEKAMNLFLGFFDHIFVDGGYRLTEQLLPIVDASAYLFITTTLELISLRSASRCLDLLEQLNYSPEKTKIVINRLHSKHEAINLEKAKDILKYSLIQLFHNDYEAACQSANLGQAVAVACPNSVLRRQFDEFALKIENKFADDQKNRKDFGRFSKVFKRMIGHVSQRPA